MSESVQRQTRDGAVWLSGLNLTQAPYQRPANPPLIQTLNEFESVSSGEERDFSPPPEGTCLKASSVRQGVGLLG